MLIETCTAIKTLLQCRRHAICEAFEKKQPFVERRKGWVCFYKIKPNQWQRRHQVAG